MVQLVTWNDWGEGTQIEPSVQTGCRDLAETQRLRRRYVDPKFAPAAADLLLSVEWYKLNKKYRADPAIRAKLAAFSRLSSTGRWRKHGPCWQSIGKRMLLHFVVQ